MPLSTGFCALRQFDHDPVLDKAEGGCKKREGAMLAAPRPAKERQSSKARLAAALRLKAGSLPWVGCHSDRAATEMRSRALG